MDKRKVSTDKEIRFRADGKGGASLDSPGVRVDTDRQDRPGGILARRMKKTLGVGTGSGPDGSFLRDVGRRSLDALTSMGSSRRDSSGSDADPATIAVMWDQLPETVSAKAFLPYLTQARNGSIPLLILLETMHRLEENLPAESYLSLIKLLSKPANIQAMMTILTSSETQYVGVPSDTNSTSQTDAQSNTAPSEMVKRERKAPTVVAMLFANGPQSLRKSLINNPAHIELLVKFFESKDSLDPLVVGRVAKVAFACLSEFPREMMPVVSKRPFFVQGLVDHVDAAPAAELLTQLFSVSYPESFSTLMFGPMNTDGVLLLASKDVYSMVADAVTKAIERHAEPNATAIATLENSLKAVAHLSIRAMSTPKFSSSGASASKGDQLNEAVSTMNAFQSPHQLMRMIDVALVHGKRDPVKRPLNIVLSSLIELLHAFYAGCKSPSGTVRRAVCSVSLDTFEYELRKRLPELVAIVNEALEQSLQPLGTLRIKIIEILVFLFAFQQEKTVQVLLGTGIHRTLLPLVRRYPKNTVLHLLVATCVEGSMIGRNVSLKEAWFKDANLVVELMNMWESSQSAEVHFRGSVSKMIRAVRRYADKNVTILQGYISPEVTKSFMSVSSAVLADAEAVEKTPLGGSRPERQEVSVLRTMKPVNSSLI
uniref:Uncharacterized protein n=1 Tax=Compsopogon caeruleus TaxID=31354 RepID=A0A7S1TCH0_9RHOD|mmetsp:Transcript_17455/g.36236  ORF Transcript_17455/g.36236 Transcript_17455/m.36236 type:complete len:655 (+) Transcript_17455:188-2152(+)